MKTTKMGDKNLTKIRKQRKTTQILGIATYNAGTLAADIKILEL
jgi:hypothetical protein